MKKELIGTKEVASRLSVSARKLEQMIERAELPAFIKIGRIRKWDSADIDAWIDTQLGKRGAHAIEADS